MRLRDIITAVFFTLLLGSVWIFLAQKVHALETQVLFLQTRLEKVEKQARSASQHAYELDQQLQAVRAAQTKPQQWPKLNIRPVQVPGASRSSLEQTLRQIDPATARTLISLLGAL